MPAADAWSAQTRWANQAPHNGAGFGRFPESLLLLTVNERTERALQSYFVAIVTVVFKFEPGSHDTFNRTTEEIFQYIFIEIA